MSESKTGKLRLVTVTGAAGPVSYQLNDQQGEWLSCGMDSVGPVCGMCFALKTRN